MLKLGEIGKILEKHLNLFFKMYYKNSHCISSFELFRKFNRSKIKRKYKQYLKEYKADNKQQLAAKIFNYCFYLILLDIIKNNIIFALPNVFGKDSEIAMKTFEGEEFKRLYRKGKFNDVDFVLSNFKGHQIFYNYECKSGTKEKPIYVSHNLRDQITQNTNAGKSYF